MPIGLRQLLLLIDMEALWAPLMMITMEVLWAPLMMKHLLQIAGVAGVAVALPLGAAEGVLVSSAGPDAGLILVLSVPTVQLVRMQSQAKVAEVHVRPAHHLHRAHRVQNILDAKGSLQWPHQPLCLPSGGVALRLKPLTMSRMQQSQMMPRTQHHPMASPARLNEIAVVNLAFFQLTSVGWMLNLMHNLASTRGWRSFLCS